MLSTCIEVKKKRGEPEDGLKLPSTKHRSLPDFPQPQHDHKSPNFSFNSKIVDVVLSNKPNFIIIVLLLTKPKLCKRRRAFGPNLNIVSVWTMYSKGSYMDPGGTGVESQ